MDLACALQVSSAFAGSPQQDPTGLLRPRTVSIGAFLLAAAITVGATEALWRGQFLQPALAVGIFGGLTYAISRRQNWARLLFTALYVCLLPFSAIQIARLWTEYPGLMGMSAVLAAAEAAGLLLLYVEPSRRWFHAGEPVAEADNAP